MTTFHKSPWFLTIVGLTIFGCGYIVADDSRIERERELATVKQKLAEVSQLYASLPATEKQYAALQIKWRERGEK